MKGILIKDWTKFDYKNPQHRAKLSENLGKFLAEPNQNPEIKSALAKIQEFGTAQDFPTTVVQVLEKYHLTTAYDEGWKQIFNVRDFSGTTEDGFDILDVESGLTFNKIPIGQKLEVYKMWGAKSKVYFDYYGAALGWHRSLFENQKWWVLEDNAIEFRNKAYAKQAAVFYALLEAVGATGAVAWQNPVPAALANTDATYTANRDIQTLNAAAQQIILAVKDKGYGVTVQNAVFKVLVPVQLMGRVKLALGLLQQGFAGSSGLANYAFQPIVTTMLSSSSYGWVILPNNKLKAGLKMDLSIFGAFESLAYTDVAAGWMSYGGAVGDTDQVARIAFA